MSNSKIIALIVAGGSGSRMKSCCSFVPKQFARFNGDFVLNYSYRAFADNANVFGIQFVFNIEDKIFYNKLLDTKAKILGIAESGKSRRESVLSGLMAIEKYDPDYVLIHDAARPLVSSSLINNVIKKLESGYDGVAPAISISDTVVVKNNNEIVSTLNREKLLALQTPQGFKFSAIIKCHLETKNDKNNNHTDDISLAKQNNCKITYVKGEKRNFKITTSFDLQLLQMMNHYNFLD